ncbi:MAG: tripartite tricarboxylate transporter TctB family protein [Burkholderiales bacterium]|nr:tripartite tricarboxylate transporter TctB family protein [Burkholderiales bacterium]
MSKRILDMVFSAFLIAGAIYLWNVADSFPVFEKFKSVDSDYWPKLVLVLIILMALLLLVQSVIEYLLLVYTNVRTTIESHEIGTVSYIKLIATGVLIVGYVFALEPLGFIVSTLGFLYIAENIPEYENWKVKLVFPVLFTAVLMFFFIYLLSLSLPRGSGIFGTLSLLFY